MLGRRSVVMFMKETAPRMKTMITATTTVNGFLTLNFESME